MIEIPLECIVELLLHSEKWLLIGVGPLPAGVVAKKDASVARRRWSVLNASEHSQGEMLFCLAGESYFGLDRVLYRCVPGTLFIIEPHMLHDDFYPPEASGLDHLWIRVLGNQVVVGWSRIEGGQLLRQHERTHVFGERELGLCPSRFLEGMEHANAAQRVARYRLLVGTVAMALERLLTADETVVNVAAEGLQEKVIRAIQHHIENTSGKGVTLEFLSHFSGYSKYHLHRLFKKQTGETIHNCIDRCRTTHAREMHAAGMTNKTIADELGFSCATAYIRWRRQHR